MKAGKALHDKRFTYHFVFPGLYVMNYIDLILIHFTLFFRAEIRVQFRLELDRATNELVMFQYPSIILLLEWIQRQ